MQIEGSEFKGLMEKYSSLSDDEKQIIHNFLKSGDNFETYYKTIKSYIWIKDPPTPEQFLDPVNGFLPLKIAEGLYPYIKRDFIAAMNTKDPYHNIVTYGSTRCEAKDTEVLMYDLSIKMIQDIKVGDLLMGDDATPRKVLETVSGHGQMYRVMQGRGKAYVVNAEHKLVVRDQFGVVLEIPAREFYTNKKVYTKITKGIKAVAVYNKFKDATSLPNMLDDVSLDIDKAGKQDFYGFLLDGNHRYVHPDLTVMRNTGKTVLSRLFTLYTIIYISYLRFPHLYFQINPMSDLCGYLVSFNDAKTQQLLLTPLLNILDAAPKFKRQIYENKVRMADIGEDGVIPFSEASKFGSITFPKLTLVTGSNPGDYIGGDILFGTISELNYFKEHSHVSDEEVFQVYAKLSDRIQGTIGTERFPCFVYLDSSANDAESPIESFINKKLRDNDEAFYRDYTRWEVRPHVFKKWYKANKDIPGADPEDWTTKTRNKLTFQVCIGNGDVPSFIVTDPKQLEGIPEDLIISVPEDARSTFEETLVEAIKDIAGKPSSNEAKLITDVRIIDEVFDDRLSNICGEIQVGASAVPERYIWGKIWKQFFIDEGNGRHRLKRARNEIRTIGVDTAKSAKGDIAGITMMHNELIAGVKTQVVDFTLAITPDATGINLEAINQFIIDLVYLGGVRIGTVSFDTFQSSQMIQNLRRLNIEVIELSVDRTTAPYNNLVMMLHNRFIRCGKNIFLKNNLKALFRMTTNRGKDKIDHSKGRTVNKYMGDWETSRCGVHAKDVSDSLCAASFTLLTSVTSQPMTDYEMENERLGYINNGGVREVDMQMMYKRLNRIKV